MAKCIAYLRGWIMDDPGGETLDRSFVPESFGCVSACQW